jgi:hypothetical protein
LNSFNRCQGLCAGTWAHRRPVRRPRHGSSTWAQRRPVRRQTWTISRFISPRQGRIRHRTVCVQQRSSSPKALHMVSINQPPRPPVCQCKWTDPTKFRKRTNTTVFGIIIGALRTSYQVELARDRRSRPCMKECEVGKVVVKWSANLAGSLQTLLHSV